MIVALTGATGFVGGATLDALLARGHTVRALTRRNQPPREGVTWIAGSLDDADALTRLADGADAVLHVAGVVSGSREAFQSGNVAGTRRLLAASARCSRFVHVSSLAAREPELSEYGRSKAGAERLVQDSDRAWTIVRPPGVYGPGDLEMRDLFRMARAGVMLMPPAGRVSLIHVRDLARLLLTLVERDPGRITLECDDGTPGYTHRQLARMIGIAVDRKPLALHVPGPLLAAAARADRLLRRDAAKLTLDRAAYLSHPDWTADPARRPPAELWKPEIDTAAGLRDTAAWYRANRLL